MYVPLASFFPRPRTRVLRAAKIALISCLACTSAFSWWENGHRTVARIAVLHLTAAARTRVARILNVPDTNDAVADALAAASTWADETKGQTKTGNWHYIDLALQDQKTDIPARCPNDDCVTARITFFANRLRSHAADTSFSELDSLRYLVHFVGDVHQPLHAVSDADQGGNCEHIDPQVGQAKNLHALWDGPLVDNLNPDDRALAQSLETRIQSFSDQLRTDLAAGTPDDWAWESHKVANKDAYQRLRIPVEPVIFPASCSEAPAAVSNLTIPIRQSYQDDMEPVVREQLIKAGLRLAKSLNESL
jgi:hypothetical protein